MSISSWNILGSIWDPSQFADVATRCHRTYLWNNHLFVRPLLQPVPPWNFIWRPRKMRDWYNILYKRFKIYNNLFQNIVFWVWTFHFLYFYWLFRCRLSFFLATFAGHETESPPRFRLPLHGSCHLLSSRPRHVVVEDRLTTWEVRNRRK